MEIKHNKIQKIVDDAVFPIIIEETCGQGLTKRELFAAMAMQGLFSCGRYGSSPEGLSQYAVSIADALINELNKQNETD